MTELVEGGDDKSPEGETRAGRRESRPPEPVDAELIPEDVQDAIVQRIVMQMEQYSSPHPHPEHLERYAKLYPDAPKIVFEAFRDQGAHRRKVEERYLEGAERRASIGQWLAFALVAGAIFVGGLAISSGQEWAGGTIVVGALSGGIILAISGNKNGGQPAARRVPQNRRGKGEVKHIEPSPPDPSSTSSQ